MLQNKEAWLQQSKLAKMLCTGHREFGTNRWRFLSKANTLYFRLCKICEFMMCILIVNHQLNRMHCWCSWEGMLPGRCSPGKRCHTFWNGNIVLLPIVLGKVSCVPKAASQHFRLCIVEMHSRKLQHDDTSAKNVTQYVGYALASQQVK